jgi:hypothetical protein
MSSQSKLAAFSEGAPEPKKKAYNCWTCLQKLDIVIQEGRQKVKCRGNGLRDFRDVCSAWTDGNDLVHFPHAPEGFVPRSRA